MCILFKVISGVWTNARGYPIQIPHITPIFSSHWNFPLNDVNVNVAQLFAVLPGIKAFEPALAHPVAKERLWCWVFSRPNRWRWPWEPFKGSRFHSPSQKGHVNSQNCQAWFCFLFVCFCLVGWLFPTLIVTVVFCHLSSVIRYLPYNLLLFSSKSLFLIMITRLESNKSPSKALSMMIPVPIYSKVGHVSSLEGIIMSCIIHHAPVVIHHS